jgi:hypothetical protein
MLVLGQDVFYHSTQREIDMGLQPTFVGKLQSDQASDGTALVSLLTQSGWTTPEWYAEGFGEGEVSATREP